jgi:hypothetical protein
MSEGPSAELPAAIVVRGGSGSPAGADSTAIVPASLGDPPTKYVEQFALARKDPAYTAAMTARARPPGLGVRFYVSLVSLAGFGIALDALLLSAGPSLAWYVVATAFSVLWFGFLGRAIRGAWRRHTVPIERRLAYVVERRTETNLFHDDHDSPPRTIVEQRATLELEDGKRLALVGVDENLGTLVEGDVGVAYTQDGRLVAFRRLVS